MARYILALAVLSACGGSVEESLSFERVAVVTDVDWIGSMIRAFGFAMPGEVRVFDDDDLEAAREWISEKA